jgi:two-component system response regulator YesN
VIETIIVDDDVEVLEGLRTFIRWEGMGFRIVGTAADGASALALVRRHRPGLLIADITMPSMDGFELIRECKRCVPELRSVILTCHEEFGYAQEAIHLGVMDYLLKITLTPEKLQDVLSRIRADIARDEKATGVLETLRKELVSQRLFVQSEFFVTLIDGDRQEAERLITRATILGIGFPGTAFRVFAFFLDNHRIDPARRNQRDRDAAAVLDVLSDQFSAQKDITLFEYGDATVILIRWYPAGPGTIGSAFSERVHAALRRIGKSTGRSASCCASGPFTDIRDLRAAVQECSGLRDAYFYQGSGRLVTEPAGWPEDGPGLPYEELSQMLAHVLHAPEDPAIAQFLDRLDASCGGGTHAPAGVRSLLSRLMVDVDAAANRRGFVMEHPPGEGHTWNVCVGMFRSALLQFRDNARTALQRSSRDEINRVLAHIQGHLGKSIRCETMAALVGLNASYFSRLFKKEMGVSFTDYLMRQRIDRSMDLLATTRMSFEEVTWAVGLENVSYFHRMFKKHTGSTPRQARRRGHGSLPGPAAAPKS